PPAGTSSRTVIEYETDGAAVTLASLHAGDALGERCRAVSPTHPTVEPSPPGRRALPTRPSSEVETSRPQRLWRSYSGSRHPIVAANIAAASRAAATSCIRMIRA